MNDFQQGQQAIVNPVWTAKAGEVNASAAQGHKLALVNAALKRRIATADHETRTDIWQGGVAGAAAAAAGLLALWLIFGRGK